jgi:hypothetical protein
MAVRKKRKGCISFVVAVTLICITVIKIQQIKSDDLGMFIDPISERIQIIEFRL